MFLVLLLHPIPLLIYLYIIYLFHFHFLLRFSFDLDLLDESEESLLLEELLLLLEDFFSTFYFTGYYGSLSLDDETSTSYRFLVVRFQSPSKPSCTSGGFSLFNSYCKFFSLNILNNYNYLYYIVRDGL